MSGVIFKMEKFPLLGQIALLQRNDQDSYFGSKYEELHKSNDFEEFFLDYEKDLEQLDVTSWEIIRNEANILCATKDKNERWSCLFEKLNEVRGYVFLKSKGCKEVRFIPRSTRNGVESPDLEGTIGNNKMLCEVKTKNQSDLYMDAVNTSQVIRTNEFLSPKLKELLEKTFSKAHSQLTSVPGSNGFEKFIYLNIEYDNENVDPTFRDKLNIQSRNVFDSMGFNDVKLIIHNE